MASMLTLTLVISPWLQIKYTCWSVVSNSIEMKEVKGVPLLVLANKQDLPGALSAERLTELLSLRSVHDRKWIVHSTVANRNEGLKEAIKEFISLL